MIRLKKSSYLEIRDHAYKSLPDEACGLLGGREENGIKVVEKVYFLRNIDLSPDHFSMDPKEQFDAVRNMRKHNLVLLGNFHSHPSSPARPSGEDKRLAFDPEASYLIISLADTSEVLKSFRIKWGESMEEPLEITEEREK